MTLTVLGKYGTFPARDGACSGYLLEANGTKVLIDCGNGVLSRLQSYAAIEELDAIILSHLHFDHIADIFPLKYALETKQALGQPIGRKRLVFPATPAHIASEFADAGVFDIRTIVEGMELTINDIRFAFTGMTHLIESYAITVEYAGKKLVYSGDTGMNTRLAEVARNADLFLCESTFASDDDKASNNHHLSAANAGRVAHQAQARQLLLTHLWYEEDEARYIHYAQQHFARSITAQERKTYVV